MWVGVVWWGAKFLTCEIVWKTEKMGDENNDRHGEAEVFYFGLDLVYENMSINRLRYFTPNHAEKINKQIKSKSKRRGIRTKTWKTTPFLETSLHLHFNNTRPSFISFLYINTKEFGGNQ